MFSAVASPYTQVNYSSLRAYQFPLLGDTTHAVFSRLGGVSHAPWNSLNMGQTVGDAPEHVAQNVALACAALKLSANRLASCHLVHGKAVVIARANNGLAPLPKADAIITNQLGLPLTMRFADCVPILLYDPATPAIGLAHAGWRGTMQNVMGSVISAMRYYYGSNPANLKIVIGPSIGPCCYEVGDDVFAAAKESFTNSAQFFEPYADRYKFNIWQANYHQAEAAGAKEIVISGLCTACRTDAFFSHRAEKGQTGRFGIFLSLPDKEGS